MLLIHNPWAPGSMTTLAATAAVSAYSNISTRMCRKVVHRIIELFGLEGISQLTHLHGHGQGCHLLDGPHPTWLWRPPGSSSPECSEHSRRDVQEFTWSRHMVIAHRDFLHFQLWRALRGNTFPHTQRQKFTAAASEHLLSRAFIWPSCAYSCYFFTGWTDLIKSK